MAHEDLEDLETLWPDVPRVAFGEAKEGDPLRLNAHLGMMRRSYFSDFAFTDGYREAATTLFEALRSGVPGLPGPEQVVFPLAFLWRHHVELALKHIIKDARCLYGEKGTFPKHHKLEPLWKTAKRYIEKVGGANDPDLQNVEQAIRELAMLDPQSIAFRYPPDRADSPIRSLPEIINLQRMHEGMEALANFLGGARSQLGAALEHRSEMESYYGDW